VRLCFIVSHKTSITRCQFAVLNKYRVTVNLGNGLRDILFKFYYNYETETCAKVCNVDTFRSFYFVMVAFCVFAAWPRVDIAAQMADFKWARGSAAHSFVPGNKIEANVVQNTTRNFPRGTRYMRGATLSRKVPCAGHKEEAWLQREAFVQRSDTP